MKNPYAPFSTFVPPKWRKWHDANRDLIAEVMWVAAGLGAPELSYGSVIHDPPEDRHCRLQREASASTVLYSRPGTSSAVFVRDETGRAKIQRGWLKAQLLSFIERANSKAVYDRWLVDGGALKRTRFDTPNGGRPFGAFPLVLGKNNDHISVLRAFFSTLGVTLPEFRPYSDPLRTMSLNIAEMTQRDADILLSFIPKPFYFSKFHSWIAIDPTECNANYNAIIIPQHYIATVENLWLTLPRRPSEPAPAWAVQLAEIVSDELQREGGDLAGLGEYIALRAGQAGIELIGDLEMVAGEPVPERIFRLINAELGRQAKRLRKRPK